MKHCSPPLLCSADNAARVAQLASKHARSVAATGQHSPAQPTAGVGPSPALQACSTEDQQAAVAASAQIPALQGAQQPAAPRLHSSSGCASLAAGKPRAALKPLAPAGLACPAGRQPQEATELHHSSSSSSDATCSTRRNLLSGRSVSGCSSRSASPSLSARSSSKGSGGGSGSRQVSAAPGSTASTSSGRSAPGAQTQSSPISSLPAVRSPASARSSGAPPSFPPSTGEPGSHRQAPRPLPSFCLQSPTAAAVETAGPIGYASRQAASHVPARAGLAAETAAGVPGHVVRGPDSSGSMAAGLPGPEDERLAQAASQAACQSGAGSTAEVGTRLQEQLDRWALAANARVAPTAHRLLTLHVDLLHAGWTAS